MHFLSDAYRLRTAILAERAEERAKAAAVKAAAPAPAIAHAPVAPDAPKRPGFSFGRILRFPRSLSPMKVR